MAKMELKDFLEKCLTVNMHFKVIEEIPNGHNKLLYEYINIKDLLKDESILHRIVSGWCEAGLTIIWVYVYPEGIKDYKELGNFYIKKYLKVIAEGTIKENGEKVHITAYDQPNIGNGNIWFFRKKKGSKIEEVSHCCGNDPKGLELVERLKAAKKKD